MSINYDEDNDVYELGGVQDDVFVPFTNLPGTQVRSRIDTVTANREAERASRPAATPAAAPAPAGTEELDAANARIAELESQLAASGGGGGGGQGQ